MTEEPKYLMRFVGFKEDGSGELKRTAPSGFKPNELRELPFDYSREMWWELVDDIPDLVLPEEKPEDSVYVEEETTLVGVSEEITSHSGDVGHMVTVKMDAKEAEPRIRLVLPVDVDPEEVYVIHYEGMTVKSLKLFIEQRGGKVEREWRKADLVREARKLEEASREASESS